MMFASASVLMVDELLNMAASNVYVPMGSFHCLLPLWKALLHQQKGLTQTPFKLLPLSWDVEHVRFCVSPLRVESLYLTPLWLSHTQYPLASELHICWLIFLVQDSQVGEPDVELKPLAP